MPEQTITTQTTEEIAASNEASRSQQRINQLSEKVELTSKERDELKGLVGQRDSEIATLKKENEFNSGFADMLGAHPLAKDHKDDIKAKVLAGYSVEDATFAVLGKVGKLGTQDVSQPQVAGGSATTPITSSQTEKTVAEMSLAEKREALLKQLG